MRISKMNTDENNLLFAFWLCAKGIVEPKAAYNAYVYRQTHKPGLEELAVFNGLLSVQQSIEIQTLQSLNRHPYGEAAVKLGFLTKDDLKSLLLLQINSAPTLVESFFRITEVDRQRLLKAQAAFLESGIVASWNGQGLTESHSAFG